MADQWTPEGDTMWTDFLADVFGDASTDLGGMPSAAAPESSRPSFSFGMSPSTGGSQSSSSRQSGTESGGLAPMPTQRQSSIPPLEFPSLQNSALSMPSNQKMTAPASRAPQAALSTPSAPPVTLGQSSALGSAQMPIAQQGQANVFQTNQEYAQNLAPPAEEDAPNNAHVQVLPNGTVLLRIGGQWVALGQAPQEQAAPQQEQG